MAQDISFFEDGITKTILSISSNKKSVTIKLTWPDGRTTIQKAVFAQLPKKNKTTA